MTTFAELASLKGRRAVVTGAAGHIGCIVAETLAELGADLVLVDRPGAEAGACIDALRERYQTDASFIACDLEQEGDRAALVDCVSRGSDRLDILVNNAAFVGTSELQGWTTAFEQQSLETWRRAIEVNLTAIFDLCKGLAPALRAAASASVVNVGSVYGSFAPDYSLYAGTSMGSPAAYAASKGGVIQLTRWLATTLAPAVRVNCISPGGVFRNQPAQFVERYKRRTPLGRMATEDDLRGAVGYLASDLSKYVTGHNLAVDGGWGIW